MASRETKVQGALVFSGLDILGFEYSRTRKQGEIVDNKEHLNRLKINRVLDLVFASLISYASIVNLWKNPMLACLCNHCHLICCSQVTQNLAWCHFTAHLLDNTFTDKIDCFTDYDGDKETKFKSIFTIQISRETCFNIKLPTK